MLFLCIILSLNLNVIMQICFHFFFKMLPLDTNLKQAYVNGTDDEQKFIQNLAMFLSTFLKEHGHLLEKKAVN